jgi:hypothetical protein
METFNGFKIEIMSDGVVTNVSLCEQNYVGLIENALFGIKLSNDTASDAISELFINDERIGSFFISAYGSKLVGRHFKASKNLVIIATFSSRKMLPQRITSEQLIINERILNRNAPMRIISSPKSGRRNNGLVSQDDIKIPRESLKLPEELEEMIETEFDSDITTIKIILLISPNDNRCEIKKFRGKRF